MEEKGREEEKGEDGRKKRLGDMGVEKRGAMQEKTINIDGREEGKGMMRGVGGKERKKMDGTEGRERDESGRKVRGGKKEGKKNGGHGRKERGEGRRRCGMGSGRERGKRREWGRMGKGN